MFRAVLISFRRVTIAASLLFLLICGAEVAVRIYEAVTNTTICPLSDGNCSDPSKLTIPSWSIHQELKPSATARVECRDSKSEVSFQTNSRGLRGPEPVVPKPSNTYRIVVLGDETIYAPEMPDASHFCTRLQTQLQQQSKVQIEVVNAGIPGHCPLTELVHFKQRLMGLQPDLVLLHFDWSDVADDRQIRRLVRCDESGIPATCPNAKLATAKKKPPPQEVWRRQFRLLDWALNAISTEWKLQVARQRAVSHDTDTNSYAWLREDHPEKNREFWLAVQPIIEVARLCRSSNCQFVLMTSPKPWQVSSKCSRGPGVRLQAGVTRDACYTNQAPLKVLAGFAKHHNVPFIDGSSVMTSGSDAEENFLQHAPRWSAVGHEHLAELVGKFLIEKIPGPWIGPYGSQTDIQWTSGQSLGGKLK
jgi:hypothetical protein